MGVRHVVSGSLRREGRKILLNRALVVGETGVQQWAGINFTTINILFNSWTSGRAAARRRIEEASAQLERLDRDGHYRQQAIALQHLLKRDFPALLRHTTTWIERYRLPVAFGAHALALNPNGRFDEAVQASERALRLGQRDPYRAE